MVSNLPANWPKIRICRLLFFGQKFNYPNCAKGGDCWAGDEDLPGGVWPLGRGCGEGRGEALSLVPRGESKSPRFLQLLQYVQHFMLLYRTLLGLIVASLHSLSIWWPLGEPKTEWNQKEIRTAVKRNGKIWDYSISVYVDSPLVDLQPRRHFCINQWEQFAHEILKTIQNI